MATYKAVLHNYKRADGTQLVQIRIIKDRIVTCEPTGYYVKKKEFNTAKGMVRDSNHLHEVYNRALKKKIEDLQRAELISDAEGKGLTSKEIRSSYKTVGNDKIIPFYKAQIELVEKKSSESTNELNTFKLKSFQNFLADNPNMLIKNITTDTIEKYQAFILESNSQGTANIYLASLSSVMRAAVKKGLIEYHKNPFNDFKYTEHEAKAVFLTLSELKRLYTAKLYAEKSLYRDIYMTQFFASGMRIGDAFRLKKSFIREGRLEYQMGKSKKNRSVEISSRLMKIFMQYITPGRDYIFPVIREGKDERKEVKRNNRFMNETLKELAKDLGLPADINTHSARHSFATQAQRLSKDIIGVQGSLGHSDLQTTVDYLEKLNNTQSDSVVMAVLQEFEKV